MARTQTVTILFCDLVGSTALMTRLGDDANDRVRRRFFAAVREAVAANRGEEVKSAGDGLMVAFPSSAADAVSCAVAMQRSVSRLAASDPLLGLAIRVGLSSGEASTENNDWFGVPVVEAARLEHAARTGQILCADVTRVIVGSRGGHTFTPVGALDLKGLPEPLPACEVAWEPDPGLPAIPLPSGLVVGGLPYAGRTTELAALRKAWDDAAASERRFVVVSGEQGIGKTRLAAEFAATVHGDSHIVLYGRSENDREVAYQPFAEALRWYVLAGKPSALREQVGPAGGELTRIVPALRLRLPDLPEPHAGDPVAERQGLFDAVAHVLGAISETSPVLLVIDDLEQSAAPTLALLRHIVTSPQRMRLLVVALAEETAGDAATIGALPGCIPLPLTGLALGEVASLLDRVEGPAASPGLAERIHRETEGSPRFVAELIARLHESGGAPEAVLDAACPYMGLRSFEAADSGLYFGRDEVIGALLGRLGTNRLLSVVGASGSGKSSLVRAGLVPRLRDGALPGSRDWEVLVITPGAHPLAELASRLGALAGLSAASVLRDLEADPRTFDLTVRQALANRPENARVLLVADQFEELFTLCRDDSERQRFIDALLAAISTPGGRTMAILSMRADFYGEAARYPGLAEALEVSHALLGPMSQDDLRSVVERPAAATGLRIEPGLTERILRDVGDEPGGLPLLSHALLETWKRRDGRSLTAAGYAASGGVRGAIAQTAETVYGGLSEGDQAIARDLFVRLTELGEGTEDTRRRVAFTEVVPAGASGEAVRAVITRLADARLLTTSADWVEVAHEALIREWPRLREWLDDDRDGLRVMRHLTESAHSWETLGRDEGELYRGARLSAASDWHDRAHPELNPLEREFLDASTALHERELQEAHRRVRRLRIGAAALAALFVLSLVGAGIAVLQWNSANDQKDKANAATNESEKQRVEAEGQRNAADAARGKAEAAVVEATLARLETEIPVLLKTDRSLAFALAAEAHRLSPGNRTARLLNLVLGQDPRYLGRIWPTQLHMVGFSVSRDGKYIATKSSDGLVELREPQSRRVIASAMTQTEEIYGFIAFSPDGKYLVVHRLDQSGRHDLTVLDVPSLAHVRDFSWDGVGQLGQDGLQPFTADATAYGAILRPRQPGGQWEIRLFNLRDGSERTVEIQGFSFEEAHGLSLDPTGRFMAAGSKVTGGARSLGIFDATTFQLLRTITTEVQPFTYEFAPDGNTLLVAGVSTTEGPVLELRNSTTGDLVDRTLLTGVTSLAVSAFDAAGTRLATSLMLGQGVLAALPGFRPLGPPLAILSSDPLFTAFGEKETSLYTRTINGAEQWTLTQNGLATSVSYETGAGRTARAPDGTWFVRLAADGSWSRWSLPSLRPLNRSEASPGPAAYQFLSRPLPVATSGDGRFFATVHADCVRTQQRGCSAKVIVWDAESGKAVGEPIRIPNTTPYTPSVLVTFDPERPTLAIAVPQNRIQLWDVKSDGLSMRTEFGVVGDEAPGPWVIYLDFVPGAPGSDPLLLLSDGASRLQLWNVRSDPPARVSQSDDSPASFGVGPNGTIVLALANGDARMFGTAALGKSDPTATRVVHDAVPAAIYPWSYFSFSADGKRMAVVRDDGIVLPGGVGQVEVWDLEKNEKIGSNFAAAGPASAAWMSPDGSKVTVVSDQAVIVWDLDTKLWADKVCFAAGRNLTEAEWTKYFPGRDYAVTCDQWSAKPKT